MADLRGSELFPTAIGRDGLADEIGGYGNAITIDSSNSEGEPAPRVHQGPPPSRRLLVVNPRPSQLKAGKRLTSTGKTMGGAGATGTGSEADGEGGEPWSIS